MYICGEGESIPVPEDPLTVESTAAARDSLFVCPAGSCGVPARRAAGMQQAGAAQPSVLLNLRGTAAVLHSARVCSSSPRFWQEAGEAVSSLIGAGTVETSQACYLPQSPDGVPVIGAVPNISGAYIASGELLRWGHHAPLQAPCWAAAGWPAMTQHMAADTALQTLRTVTMVQLELCAAGHTCWGILNGPATGEAMAELITGGKSQISLKAFSPARFTRRFAFA